MLVLVLVLLQFAHMFGGKINKPVQFGPKLDLAPYMSHKQVRWPCSPCQLPRGSS